MGKGNGNVIEGGKLVVAGLGISFVAWLAYKLSKIKLPNLGDLLPDIDIAIPPLPDVSWIWRSPAGFTLEEMKAQVENAKERYRIGTKVLLSGALIPFPDSNFISDPDFRIANVLDWDKMLVGWVEAMNAAYNLYTIDISNRDAFEQNHLKINAYYQQKVGIPQEYWPTNIPYSYVDFVSNPEWNLTWIQDRWTEAYAAWQEFQRTQPSPRIYPSYPIDYPTFAAIFLTHQKLPPNFQVFDQYDPFPSKESLYNWIVSYFYNLWPINSPEELYTTEADIAEIMRRGWDATPYVPNIAPYVPPQTPTPTQQQLYTNWNSMQMLIEGIGSQFPESYWPPHPHTFEESLNFTIASLRDAFSASLRAYINR
jgi:hypothetical protein